MWACIAIECCQHRNSKQTFHVRSTCSRQIDTELKIRLWKITLNQFKREFYFKITSYLLDNRVNDIVSSNQSDLSCIFFRNNQLILSAITIDALASFWLTWRHSYQSTSLSRSIHQRCEKWFESNQSHWSLEAHPSGLVNSWRPMAPMTSWTGGGNRNLFKLHLVHVCFSPIFS